MVERAASPRILLAAFCLAFLSACGTSGPTPTPAHKLEETLEFTDFVVDQAHVLTDGERHHIVEQLDHLQQRTGHQFAVVTVTGLGGEDIKAFTMRLANRWGVGRKSENDGIVLLLAPKERQARIEVGTGLEQILTDEVCATIMAQDIVPTIRRSGIPAGIEAGVAAIIRVLDGGAPITPAE